MKKAIIVIILTFLIILFTIFAIQHYNSILQENTDFTNYLLDTTDFNSAASIFLPARGEFEDVQVVNYHHGRYNDGTEYVYFDAIYSDQNYYSAKNFAENKMKLAWERYASYGHGDRLEINNRFYYCCTVYVDKDYGFAYALSEESNTITYLFLTNSDLEYMSMVELLHLYSNNTDK